jgi:hypothetical protein
VALLQILGHDLPETHAGVVEGHREDVSYPHPRSAHGLPPAA